MPEHPENVSEVEEASIDAYMDEETSNGSGPTKEEYITYLRERLKLICSEYKTFMLHKREALATSRQDILSQLRDGFQKNYAARKWIVRELRSLGETVDDPFIAV